jgi:hypothetical protein
MSVRTNDGAEAAEPRSTGTGPDGPAADGAAKGVAAGQGGPDDVTSEAAAETATEVTAEGAPAPAPAAEAAAEGAPAPATEAAAPALAPADEDQPRLADPDAGVRAQAAARQSTGPGSGPGPDADAPAPKKPTRRPPSVTLDTARPEGGGRAAPRDAPAPARQWPLLTVLALTGLGLMIVGIDAFADAFRVGAILIGVALITGAVLRRILPSVGMLAVRSRFTDMVTYGLLGTTIVLLALVTQPKPWLDVPFLEDAVHFTVR